MDYNEIIRIVDEYKQLERHVEDYVSIAEEEGYTEYPFDFMSTITFEEKSVLIQYYNIYTEWLGSTRISYKSLGLSKEDFRTRVRSRLDG